MKKISLYLLALCAALVLTSCVSIQPQADYQLNAEEGLVVFSLTQSGDLRKNVALTFSAESNEQTHVIHQSNNTIRHWGKTVTATETDYVHPVGRLVVMRLPEGVYALTGWNVQPSAEQNGRYSEKNPLTKRFRVANNKALYLGNLHVNTTDQSQSLYVLDQRERDLAEFHQQYPQVSEQDVWVVSKIFLNPDHYRTRLINAYSQCEFHPDLIVASNNRLPVNAPKTRPLKFDGEEVEVSRIDGVRLKLGYPEGTQFITFKAELSDARQYEQDKQFVTRWMQSLVDLMKDVQVQQQQHRMLDSISVDSDTVETKGVISTVALFSDIDHMIISLFFTNQPEANRRYQNVDEFQQLKNNIIQHYEDCVIEHLNE